MSKQKPVKSTQWIVENGAVATYYTTKLLGMRVSVARDHASDSWCLCWAGNSVVFDAPETCCIEVSPVTKAPVHTRRCEEAALLEAVARVRHWACRLALEAQCERVDFGLTGGAPSQQTGSAPSETRRTPRFVVEKNSEADGFLLRDTHTGRVLGRDGGEPEDQSLVRHWAWVPLELNRLAEELS